jgi:phosphoribosyl-dephospho-CoA transferase
MNKVAKLVSVTLTTRVVVDENASDEQIFDAALPRLKEKAKEEMFENLDDIVNDMECPYDPVVELTPEEIEVLSKNKFGC